MEIIRVGAKKEIKKLKVAVYCRVSTTREDQEDSLETQTKAYEKLIKSHPDWEYVNTFSDAISGLNAEKRTSFMNMIKEAMEGKIDRILCKSISRFSRNATECKKYCDMLRDKGVIVEFEKEHIATDNPNSAFLFSLMSAVAQGESESISENVKWSNRERVKRGEYNLGNNRILGYDTVDGKLVPNKDADAVRFIFNSYLEGKNVDEISSQLAEIGILTRKGNPISRGNILYILKNETYKGDKRLQKKPPRDMITGKPDLTADYVSSYLENDHPAIVDREVWEAVNQKLEEIQKWEETIGHNNGKGHFLFGRVFCGDCGSPMTRRTVTAAGIKRKVWICRERRGKGKTCMMRRVKEEDLLTQICMELGWEQFDEEEFDKTVERVDVLEFGVEVKTREAA